MPGLLPLPYLRHISLAKRGFANLDLGSRAVQSPELPTQQEQDPRAHRTDQPQQFGNRNRGNALQARNSRNVKIFLFRPPTRRAALGRDEKEAAEPTASRPRISDVCRRRRGAKITSLRFNSPSGRASRVQPQRSAAPASPGAAARAPST